MEAVAIAVAILSGLASTLFALWLKQGLLERIRRAEEDMNKKVNGTVYEVQQSALAEKLEELKANIKELDERMERGVSLIHQLSIAIARLEKGG